jgi:exonuclease SbcD
VTSLAVTADLHVDDYAAIPGRFDDILRTVAWVARTARERGAEALIVAGDYTESKTPVRAPRVVKIAAALAAGPARQIHVRGNHDGEWQGESIVTDLARTPGWTGYAQPGFENVGDVAVCVIPFLDRPWLRTQPGFEMVPEADVFHALAERYLAIARGLYAQAMSVGAKAAILVGHQQLRGAQMTDKQHALLGDVDLLIDARALSAIGYSAVVLGHVHRAQTVVDDPACPVLYAGAVERVDFNEEQEEKSFVLLDVEPGRTVSIERIPTPARRYVTIDAAAWPENPEHGGPDAGILRDAVVRVVNVPREDDVRQVQRTLENEGAWAVTEIRRAPVEAEAPAGGMDESLSAEEALETYFADDADREALIELGREILAGATA